MEGDKPGGLGVVALPGPWSGPPIPPPGPSSSSRALPRGAGSESGRKQGGERVFIGLSQHSCGSTFFWDPRWGCETGQNG
eukprot:2510033-Rhodomonas_salina.2